MPAMRLGPLLTALLGLLLAASAALAGPADEARAAEKAGDREAAIAAWRRAIEADPTDADAYESLGRLQLRAKRFDDAVTTFERLVKSAPAYAKGQYRLAFALRKAGRYREAAGAYRAFIAQAPDDADARFGLAESLRRQGDKPGALEAYRAYVELERRPSEAKWVARAKAAIADLEASAATAPGAERPLEPALVAGAAPEATAAAAVGDPDEAFARGDYAAARDGYRAALKARPDAPALHHRLAVSAALTGQDAEALRHAHAAVRLDPGNPAAVDLAATLRARQDTKRPPAPPQLAEAELALREGRLRTALRLAAEGAKAGGPTLGGLHRVRGRALLALGRAAEARAALATAIAHGEGGPQLWRELAWAARLQGDGAAAARLLDLAASAAPVDHPLAARAHRRLAGLQPQDEP